MTKVQISLPDKLAEEALRVDELVSAMDRMAAIPKPATMSPDEVAQEIAAMRAERRTKTAH